jgi:DNA (cytosine-5)-methyltransferase 1
MYLLIDTMESEFLAAGYLMDRQIVDASDFGVLQKRQRVIIVGWQKKLPISPPVFAKVPVQATNVMNDILADLPPIEPNKNEPFLDYIKSPSKYLVDFNLRIPKEPLTLHFARFINTNDSQIYKIAIDTLFNTGKQLSYKDLPQNLKTQKNEKSFLDRFCVIRGNSSTTYTMVAHIAKDGHHYIYPDATLQQVRSISVREAARIQSFPDNYFFEGARGAMFTQIGNAVPPLVAQAIAKTIKQILWKL